MDKRDLVNILEEETGQFINNIARELEQSHDQWFDNFGFPLFGESSKEYFEQVYFQSYLESYVRKMINSILRELSFENISDELVWPEFNYVGVYEGYTNIECEEKFGFELINLDTKTGYRYSRFKYDEVDNLLTKGNVNSIVLVVWEGKDEIIGYSYGDSRIRIVNLWDFFMELFPELDEEDISTIYELFVKYVADAVEKAYSMISLNTLPGFTPSYLFKTRNQTIIEFRNNVKNLSCFYIKNPLYKHVEENSKRLITQYKLSDYFLDKKMDLMFVGKADYAKSFLTSEYLYRYFKNNPMFDYTPIVSGYIKSIEQFLGYICETHRNSQGNPSTIRLETLGDYISYIKSNKVIRKEICFAKKLIVSCLDGYRDESRNHLFHRDYFNSWKQVEIIRNNTMFLYCIVSSAFDTSLIESEQIKSNILNDCYDQMFQVIDEQKEDYYTLIIHGIEYSGFRKDRREKGLTFNSDGLIENSVVFRKFDYDHYETIELSRENMPSEIWTSDTFSEKIKQIWPAQ